MSKRFLPFAVMAVACWSSPLASQSPDWLSRILSAAQLPISAAKARVEGTPSDEIRKVLEVMIGAKVPADEAHDVIDEERAARRENGPVDNFGAFVQSQLKAGLRGRELAAAIHAEHEARGKGRRGGSAMGNRGDKGKVNAPNGQSDSGKGNAGAGAGKAAGAANGAGGRARGGRAPGDTNSASGAAANGRKPKEKGRPANHPSQPNN